MSLLKNILAFVLLTVSQCVYAGHGFSLYGDLKYPVDFKHFEYVNPLAPQKGSITFGVLGTFDSLNPFIVKGTAGAGLGMLYSSALYATLLESSKDEPSSSYCYIADHLEVENDFKRVTFYLRQEAIFSDGSPITSQDVLFSFRHLVDEGHPLYKAYYHDVSDVKIIDSHTIQFNFSQYNRELPGILGQFPILSKAFYTKHSFNKADLTVPVGSGPYKITEVEPGSRLVYTRIDSFWGNKLPVIKGRYNFKKIIYRYFKDDNVMFEDFKAGGHDVRLENIAKNWVQGYDVPAVKEGEIIKKEFKFKSPAAFQGLIMNMRRDLFTDLRVRQALSVLLDFEFMNKTFFYHQYERLNSYFQNSELAAMGIPQGKELSLLQVYKDKLPMRLFTEEFRFPVNDGSGVIREQMLKAKQLLIGAGYIFKDKRLYYKKTGAPFKFEILYTGSGVEKILQTYAANLKRLGIEVTLRQVDTAQYTYRVENFDFDMIIGVIPQSISPGNEQRDFWQSSESKMTGGRNYGGIKNPIIDALIEGLIASQTREDLVAHTRALDRCLLWNYYTIPLYAKASSFMAYRKKIGMPTVMPRYMIDIDAFWEK